MHSKIRGVEQALDAVETAGRMAALADELLANEVRRARQEGATWDAIAARLGRSRQAVQKRFGSAPPAVPLDPAHPGKGTPTYGALRTRGMQMRCAVCDQVKPGSKFPTVRRQRPGGPVREERCRECREAGRSRRSSGEAAR